MFAAITGHSSANASKGGKFCFGRHAVSHPKIALRTRNLSSSTTESADNMDVEC
jgi:hypothetical protein